MGVQPILSVTVSVKKIKGAARQRNVVTLGVDEPSNLGQNIKLNHPRAIFQPRRQAERQPSNSNAVRGKAFVASDQRPWSEATKTGPAD